MHVGCHKLLQTVCRFTKIASFETEKINSFTKPSTKSVKSTHNYVNHSTESFKSCSRYFPKNPGFSKFIRKELRSMKFTTTM